MVGRVRGGVVRRRVIRVRGVAVGRVVRGRPDAARGARREAVVGRSRRGREGLVAVAGVGHRAQAVDGAVHGELGGAEALHDIPPAGLAAVLEDRQHAVRRGETALDALGGDRAPGDHAVPVEEGAGQRVRADGRVALGGREEGPAAGHGRGPAARGGAGGGEGAVASARDRSPRAVGRRTRRTARAEQRAHRGERVVGEAAGPGEVPEGVGELRVGGVRVGGGADLVGDLAEEQAVAAGEGGQDRIVQRGRLQEVRRGQEQRGRVRQVEGEPAVLAGERARARPDDLPGGGEFVEHRRGVVAHA
ncbi:hypothetical protein a10_07377 [Streptomyces acidiscabies]|nr:hypothetical protein a10_07377 [Streptomyces acidiscabies]